jgi:hypothetical protein
LGVLLCLCYLQNTEPRALAAEQAAKTAPDLATKVAWTEIAIEWHALATKTAVGFTEDLHIG